jgi:NCAIR mutase (PurE)-related protein
VRRSSREPRPLSLGGWNGRANGNGEQDSAGPPRERRRALDRDRDARDQRIEEATAATLVALEHLTEAEDARTAATVMVGEALRELLAEDVTPERAAALLELDAAEVRRLSKVVVVTTATDGANPPVVAAGTSDSPGAPGSPMQPDLSASEGVIRRSG